MAVEIGGRLRPKRGAGGQLGAVEIDGVVIAAQGELPALSRLGPAAGAQEVLPGNPSFDRPALVLVLPLVQRAAQLDLRLDVEVAVTLEALVTAGAAPRQEHVQDRVGS